VARLITLGLAAIALAAGILVGPAVEPASAGTLWLKSCAYFGDPGTARDVSGPVWEAQAPGTFSLPNRCPMGGSFQIDSSSQTRALRHKRAMAYGDATEHRDHRRPNTVEPGADHSQLQLRGVCRELLLERWLPASLGRG